MLATKVQNKTPAWNQNFAVKIACCESLFAAWEGGERWKNSRYLHLKNLWAFSRVFQLARTPTASNRYTFSRRENGQSLHDSWWNFNAKCLDSAARIEREKSRNCIWHRRGQSFDDFNSREINANSSHGLHRMQFAINLTARIYYIMQQHPLNAPSGWLVAVRLKSFIHFYTSPNITHNWSPSRQISVRPYIIGFAPKAVQQRVEINSDVTVTTREPIIHPIKLF